MNGAVHWQNRCSVNIDFFFIYLSSRWAMIGIYVDLLIRVDIKIFAMKWNRRWHPSGILVVEWWRMCVRMWEWDHVAHDLIWFGCTEWVMNAKHTSSSGPFFERIACYVHRIDSWWVNQTIRADEQDPKCKQLPFYLFTRIYELLFVFVFGLSWNVETKKKMYASVSASRCLFNSRPESGRRDYIWLYRANMAEEKLTNPFISDISITAMRGINSFE